MSSGTRVAAGTCAFMYGAVSHAIANVRCAWSSAEGGH
jgi:hypothetical protein